MIRAQVFILGASLALIFGMATEAYAENVSPLYVFNQSIGQGAGGCWTCGFIGIFLLALDEFAKMVFTYLASFFIVLAPVSFAIWVAWRGGILLANGGEDGKTFIWDMTKKSTLFFVIWILLTANNTFTPTDPSATPDEQPWAYSAAGPNVAGLVIDLSDDLRMAILDNDPAANLGCVDVFQNAGFETENQYAEKAAELICAIERTHAAGLASAYGMIVGAWNGISFNLSWNMGAEVSRFFAAFFNAIVITMFAVLLGLIFIKSLVWLMTKTLSVLIQIVFIAAFSPLMGLAYLFKPTRQYALRGIQMTVGSLASALGIALTMALAFHLILSVPYAFNLAIQSGNWGDLSPISNSPKIVQMREFIVRIGVLDPTDDLFIPMTFLTPWFWHFVLAAFAVYTLGRKILGLVENLIGAPGADGDNRSAESLAQTAGNAVSFGAKMGIGAVALKGTMLAAQGAGKASQAGASGLRKAGMPDFDFKNINPFGSAARNAAAKGRSGLGGRS